LELKSAQLLENKNGWGRVARFMLGAANRDPAAASRYLEGRAVLILGVEDDKTVTGVGDIDPAHVQDGTGKYLDVDGPRWELRRVPVSGSDHSVAVIEVQPPELDKVFVCQDTGGGNRSGAVYVRRMGQTAEADYGEMKTRLQAAASARSIRADIEVELTGAAYSLAGMDELNDAYIEALMTEARMRHDGDNAGRLGLASYSSLFGTGPDRLEAVERFDRWAVERRGDWPERRDTLVGLLGQGVGMTVSNKGSRVLEAPAVRITVRQARAVVWRDPAEDTLRHSAFPSSMASNEYLPYVGALDPVDLAGVSPLGYPLEWENTDPDSVTVEFQPSALRPGQPSKIDPDDYVLIAVDTHAERVIVEWSATFRDVEGVLRGEITLPVVPILDAPQARQHLDSLIV
jgi:hypothetical protein